MGYYARYCKDAQEKNIENWREFYIVEIEKTSEAILAYRNPHGFWKKGEWVITQNLHPELPMTFPKYDDAFVYLESIANKSTMPVNSVPSLYKPPF